MKVLLLAGEPSGDRLAAGVARAIRALRPDSEVRAMGGGAVREAGASLVVDSTPLAVVGLTEVVPMLPSLWRARATLLDVLDAWRPDVVVPVDYPDFNLVIARAARRRGIPVAWLVGPQVWAWRPGRVATYAKVVSRMLVVFPFEVETWRRAGVPVEHVGHHLLDLGDDAPDESQARAELGVPPGARVLAILPGSRRRELRHVWPTVARAARRLAATRPDLRLVLPVAPGLRRDAMDLDLLGEARPGTIVLDGRAATALAACDAAIVASGTATLETALVPRPLVAVYRVGWTTMALSRALAAPGFLERGLFALPNLVLGREVVPELYQERFTVDAVEREAGRLLDDEAARTRMAEELGGIRSALGGRGALERAAAAIVRLGDGSARA